jgi:hypothetical protein
MAEVTPNSETVQSTHSDESASPLRVEFWPLDRLVPSPRNARTHDDAQVAEIAGSIRAFGFRNPILVGEDGDVVAGHGRLAAARMLGMKEVPVIPLHGLSEVQRRQLMLADNRIALNAGWDLQMLQLELRDLSGLGANLSTLGFTRQELARALQPGAAGLTDENEIPAVAETAVSKAGDVWSLGEHRVVCGDSTDAQVVAAALGTRKPLLMVTDPPYGVNYDPEWRNQRSISNSKRTGKVRNDERADWAEAWKLFPGNIAYVWHAALNTPTFAQSLEREGFTIRAQIIWAKERRLPLAARALLVRRSQQGQLDRRPQADHALEHPERWSGHRDGAWHAEARGVYAPADAQQQRAR